MYDGMPSVVVYIIYILCVCACIFVLCVCVCVCMCVCVWVRARSPGQLIVWPRFVIKKQSGPEKSLCTSEYIYNT